MKILKVYIHNFKGIRDTKILDLNHNLVILDGPNGFGKTTIFDVIELCLRGRLNHIDVNNCVTKDTNNYKKPFYQNFIDDHVTIKIMLENNEKKKLTIIKYLPQNHKRKSKENSKENKVTDWDLLETYTEPSDNFETDFSREDSSKLTQQDINNFFYANGSYNLQDTYLLFNYLQQEENIYFLKKSESDKNESLAFLFQTDKEEKDLEHLKKILTTLNGIKEEIKNRLDSIKKSSVENKSQEYESLFPHTDKINFDLENPFKDVKLSDIDTYYQNLHLKLNDLDAFTKSFSESEYNNLLLIQKITKLLNNDVYSQAYLLQNLLTPQHLSSFKTQQYVNALTSKDKYSITQIETYKEILRYLDQPSTAVDKISSLINTRVELLKKSDTTTNLIVELNQLREQLFIKSKTLLVSQTDCNCPLCNSHFENIALLEESINKKTQIFEAINKKAISEIKKIELELDSLIQEILHKLNNNHSTNNFIVEKDFYDVIIATQPQIDSIKTINDFINQIDLTLSEHILEIPVSPYIFRQKLQLFKEDVMKRKTFINNTKTVNLHLFKDYFNNDYSSVKIINEEKIQNKKQYIDNLYMQLKLKQKVDLEEKQEYIKNKLAIIKSLKEKIDAQITEFKKQMIEKIQIPLFIYSGKILQNYQQGMGIFIEMKSKSIRFITDSSTDHDAIHCLSSGQLAILAISFLLSINKIYKLNKANFLAIDDPVQTLDDLNSHGLIELLRHDFKDFQIIVSTHEEDMARYMKYKCDKFDFNSQIYNIQQEFFNG